MSGPLISLDSVSFSYGKNEYALKDISLSIEAGEIYSIIGRNGSGKSTLVKIISGVFFRYDGILKYSGKPFNEYDKKFLARQIAYVPQENAITDLNLTVSDLLFFGRYAYKGFTDFKNNNADISAANESLSMLGIEAFRNKKLGSLSGGERQKVFLALALVQLDITSELNGKALIVDEPLTFLDVNYQFEIFNVLTKLNKRGLSILAVTHDLNIAMKYSGRTMLFDKGSLVKSGITSDIITEESLSKYFMINSQIVNFENDFHINFIPNSKI
jgi:iron complex transport system ATP-binding protein